MERFPLFLIVTVIVLIFGKVKGQDSNNCTRFYRSVQRSGAFLAGEITIPASSSSPDEQRALENSEFGFKLQLKFSRAIRSVYVRRASGTDMTGSHHTEFMIDTRMKEGKLKLSTMVRLRSLMGHLPKITRIIFNDKAICGAPLSESEINQSFIVEASPPVKTTRPVGDPGQTSSARPSNGKNKNNDNLVMLQPIEDDEYSL